MTSLRFFLLSLWVVVFCVVLSVVVLSIMSTFSIPSLHTAITVCRVYLFIPAVCFFLCPCVSFLTKRRGGGRSLSVLSGASVPPTPQRDEIFCGYTHFQATYIFPHKRPKGSLHAHARVYIYLFFFFFYFITLSFYLTFSFSFFVFFLLLKQGVENLPLENIG